MKKLSKLLGLAILFLGLTACHHPRVTENGKIVTKARTVPTFENIRISKNFVLEVTSDSMQSVQITTSSNIIPLVVTKVHDDTLDVHLKSGYSIVTQKPILLKVAVKNLNVLSVADNTNARIMDIDTKTFALQSEGNANVDLTGKADTVTINIVGTGKVNASGLKAKDVMVNVTGSSDVMVFASDELRANINGSGNVAYAGNPRIVNQKSSGIGRIRSIN